MNARSLCAAIAGAVLLAALPAQAGPDRVELPADYQTAYTLYIKVDRPDRKIVRFMYVNPEALAAARPGEPLPDGTTLVMEDHKARLGPDGEALRDNAGRFLAEEMVTAIFVQQTRQGWGEAYPPETRNGDWDYARYEPGATLALKADQKYVGCFSCHQRRAARDYNFTFSVFVKDAKR